MNKIINTSILTATLLVPSVYAESYSAWGNLHLDYQAWDHGVADNDFKQTLIGIEGGLNFSWGEFFGFYDFENIDKDSGEQGSTMSLQNHYYLGDSNFSLFSKVYSTQSPAIKETNSFLGFGYTDIGGDGWWFTPWVAANYTNVRNDFNVITDFNGLNGATVGWSAGYVFEFMGEDLLLTNWNEIELFRADDYATNNNGSTGLNGGLNLGWNITNNINATIMYRYYHNKLGADGYGDILIYRLAYTF